MKKEDAERLLEEGLARLEREDCPGAVEALARALAGLKEAGDPALLAICLEGLKRGALAAGSPDRALQALREMLALAGTGPEAGRVRLQRAALLLELGRFGEAAREAEAALGRLAGEKEEYRALFLRGLALLKEGREEEALAALGSQPGAAGAEQGRLFALQGVALCLLGRHREAVPVLESARALFPPGGVEGDQADLSLALALLVSGREEEALAGLRRLGGREEAPFHLRVEALLLAAAIPTGAWAKARAELAAGLAAAGALPESDLAAFFNLLQVCAEAAGEREAARRWFRRPGDPARSPFLVRALALMARGVAAAGPAAGERAVLAGACAILRREARDPRDRYLLQGVEEGLG